MQSAIMETPTVVIPAPEPPVIEPPVTPVAPPTTPNVTTEDPYAPGPYKFVEMTQDQMRRMYQFTSIFENANVSPVGAWLAGLPYAVLRLPCAACLPADHSS